MTHGGEFMSYFPVIAQGIFTVSTVPGFQRIIQVKTSQEHSLHQRTLTALAHVFMWMWSAFYLHSSEGALASIVAFLLASGFLGVIIYYRVFPGGRGSKEYLFALAKRDIDVHPELYGGPYNARQPEE